MWAEVMEIWHSGNVRLKLSPEIEAEVRQRQRLFMQEDVDAGLILAFMQDFTGDKVCSKQLFKDALHNEFAQPQRSPFRDGATSTSRAVFPGLITVHRKDGKGLMMSTKGCLRTVTGNRRPWTRTSLFDFYNSVDTLRRRFVDRKKRYRKAGKPCYS